MKIIKYKQLSTKGRKRFKLFNHEFRTALIIKPWSGIVEGNLALCQDGHYTIMLDYDQLPLHAIKYELTALQKYYSLGNFYIIESSPDKYHAVCFDKIDYRLYKELLEQTRIDPGFRQSRMWLLRTSKKKGHKLKLIGVLKGKEMARPKSKAHLLNYVKLMPDISKHCTEGEWDNSTKVMHVWYSS